MVSGFLLQVFIKYFGIWNYGIWNYNYENFKENRILFFRNSIDKIDVCFLLFRNLQFFLAVIRILLPRIFFFCNHFLPLKYLPKRYKEQKQGRSEQYRV